MAKVIVKIDEQEEREKLTWLRDFLEDNELEYEITNDNE